MGSHGQQQSPGQNDEGGLPLVAGDRAALVGKLGHMTVPVLLEVSTEVPKIAEEPVVIRVGSVQTEEADVWMSFDFGRGLQDRELGGGKIVEEVELVVPQRTEPVILLVHEGPVVHMSVH
ncbi:hypothetical protein CF327_g134 [Tilletia walkeri]|nr:hypothetical protein CF327_g134 [Tilletia walkeri]